MLSFSEYNNIVYAMLCIQINLFLIIYFIITFNMAKKDILEEVFGENHELDAVINGFNEVRSYQTEELHANSIYSKNNMIHSKW